MNERNEIMNVVVVVEHFLIPLRLFCQYISLKRIDGQCATPYGHCVKVRHVQQVRDSNK